MNLFEQKGFSQKPDRRPTKFYTVQTVKNIYERENLIWPLAVTKRSLFNFLSADHKYFPYGLTASYYRSAECVVGYVHELISTPLKLFSHLIPANRKMLAETYWLSFYLGEVWSLEALIGALWHEVDKLWLQMRNLMDHWKKIDANSTYKGMFQIWTFVFSTSKLFCLMANPTRGPGALTFC